MNSRACTDAKAHMPLTQRALAAAAAQRASKLGFAQNWSSPFVSQRCCCCCCGGGKTFGCFNRSPSEFIGARAEEEASSENCLSARAPSYLNLAVGHLQRRGHFNDRTHTHTHHRRRRERRRLFARSISPVRISSRGASSLNSPAREINLNSLGSLRTCCRRAATLARAHCIISQRVHCSDTTFKFTVGLNSAHYLSRRSAAMCRRLWRRRA